MKQTKKWVLLGGGAQDAFFGRVHTRASGILNLDGFELTGGLLSSDPERSRQYAEAWGIEGFGNLDEVIAAKGKFDYAVIATPNRAHHAAAVALLKAGIPILCEKPLAMSTAEAREILDAGNASGTPGGVAYTYPGYWALSVAAAIVQSGIIGKVTRFNGQYLQDWQVANLNIRQEWRQQPETSGKFNCLGDIGTHVEMALRYITGLPFAEIICSTNTVGAGRKLDDDATVLAKLEGGAQGVIFASQVAWGHSNDLQVEVSCELGSVSWQQEDPEHLTVVHHEDGKVILTRGAKVPARYNDAAGSVVIAPAPPGGHISGFFGALATLHYRLGLVLDDWEKFGRKLSGPSGEALNYHGLPSLSDGLHGMLFLDACDTSRTEKRPATV